VVCASGSFTVPFTWQNKIRGNLKTTILHYFIHGLLEFQLQNVAIDRSPQGPVKVESHALRERFGARLVSIPARGWLC
jgi:hypothetical protein